MKINTCYLLKKTFCTISHNAEPNRELPLHLFYACRSTEPVLNSVYSTLLNENVVVTRQELFVGFTKFTNHKNDILFLVNKLFLKYIWECKLRETLPNRVICLKYIANEVLCMCSISNQTRILKESVDINFETLL